jgi:heme-degrading monooxygenase HmoA
MLLKSPAFAGVAPGGVTEGAGSPRALAMAEDRSGQTVVIFVSELTGEDVEGYAAAGAAMDALAAVQPGYRGVDSTRGPEGLGITVSYWADEASAVAWRKHSEHATIREAGRGRWYRWYRLHVAEIGRSYRWQRP